MKNKLYSILMTVALICGLSMTSCKDDNEGGAANAVIVSTRAIEFPHTDALPITVNVTSDGDWTIEEIPDWLTVTPQSGAAGRTEVTVEAFNNLRDGAPDRPRKFKLNFKGGTILGAYEVTVQQAGNKYRDLEPITIAELASLEDDDAAILDGVTVYSNTESGMVVTDGTNLAYVTKQNAEVGAKIKVLGSKFEADALPYLVAEKLEDQGTATVPTFTAEDITAKLDKYKADKRTLVKVTGAFDGKTLKVEGQTNGVQVIDAAKIYKMDNFKGHQITVTGVYSGSASPVVKMVVTDIEDLGLNETIYFSDDFEWLKPATDYYKKPDGGLPISDNVGANMKSGVYNPQAGTKIFPDGSTTESKLKALGYELLALDAAQAKKSIGEAKNYLKIAITDYTGGLKLPAMPDLGDGVEGVHIYFDWTPFANSTAFDPTEIIVIVNNGGKEVVIPIDKPDLAPDAAYAWIPVDINLGDYDADHNSLVIDKDTRITIRNCDAQYPISTAVSSTCRWFIDNIRVSVPKD